MRMPRREKTFIAKPLSALILLSLLAALIYSNSFTASFHFDDRPNIVENPRIKDLSNFWDFSGTRYVGFLSFALNDHFGGLSVFGYHLINLLIHIINGFLVYNLVMLLFRTTHSNAQSESGQPHRAAPTSPWVALATALLFVSHPIQTQAVTYIVQRFASLVTLFYLLTVICYLKWRLAPSEARARYVWYAGAWMAAVLAMKTKENSFTLPFMMLLIEAVFFGPWTRKSWAAVIPFLLTLPIIPLSRSDAGIESGAGLAQQTAEISRSDYLFTQFRVIVTYLRLLVLPIRQNLDYDYPISHSLFESPVFLSFLFLLSLLAWSLYLLFNSKFKSALSGQNSQLIAFGILWFFLTLSIESSVIPISGVIFEHRLYLPSAGFFLAAAMIASHLLSRALFRNLFLTFILIIFSAAAYQRNTVWKNDFTLWKDNVAKAPGKARAHLNLGFAYEMQRQLEEAAREYRSAFRLQPDYAIAYNNLGNVLDKQGNLEEAIENFRIAIKLQPDSVEARYNLGNTLAKQGRLEEAVREYRHALRLQPDSAEIHNNLANALADAGRIEEAIEEYQGALKLHPDFVKAHYNLGIVYADQGRPEEAVMEYQTVLRLQPNHADAHNNLGVVFAKQGRLEEAVNEFQAALKLAANPAKTHYNLGQAYARLGKAKEAKEQYQKALQIKPDYEAAQRALDSLP